MEANLAICPGCAEPVPHGRLSCPSCGSLLASVGWAAQPIGMRPGREDARASAFEPTSDPAPMPVGAYVPPGPAPFVAVAAAPSATSPIPAPPPPAGPSTNPVTPAGAPDAEVASPAQLVVSVARLDEAARGLVGVGGALSAIGFVLPWSEVVIGSAGLGGYLDRWGLAGPGHALVFLVALVVVGLAVVPTVAASWLRSGVLGIALGGLLVGLAWPYLVGPLGAGPGVAATSVAAVLLLIGGIAVAWSRRHADGGSTV
jgi:hypothetical protein